MDHKMQQSLAKVTGTPTDPNAIRIYIELGFTDMLRKLNGAQTLNQCEALRLGCLLTFVESHFIRLDQSSVC